MNARQLSCLLSSLTLAFGSAFFSGCAQVPTSIGSQSNVGMIAEGERVHLDDKITAEDMVALAGKVTEKMLGSSRVQSWPGKKKQPLLVIAVPENTTHDANIITEDLQDEIIAKVLDSGVARVIDESSVSSRYDYIIKTTITSTSQRGNGGSKVTYYTCKLQLFSLRGERLGQWHDKIGMTKAPRSFF
ncbi:hypothetical protein [Desulfogranum mediterraneum]|uniref:hypothetical protein n=1 Tax=Desulfogranum mediterraneum TaxID=160661 RepID=UPI00040D0A74|nr:hypothetical protein [Desulfogranum mediterraneum]